MKRHGDSLLTGYSLPIDASSFAWITSRSKIRCQNNRVNKLIYERRKQ